MTSKNKKDLINGIQSLMDKVNEEKLINSHKQEQEIINSLHKIKLFFINPWIIIIGIIIFISLIIFYYLPDNFLENEYFIRIHIAYTKMSDLIARFIIDGIILSFIQKIFRKNNFSKEIL
jgi:hypothetical protein